MPQTPLSTPEAPIAPARVGNAEPSPISALNAAFGTVREILFRRGAPQRWRRIAAAAIGAGVVGVGVQPPPLGLLQPLFSEPEASRQFFRELALLAPWLVLLGLGLLAACVFARCFAFVFWDAVRGLPREQRTHTRFWRDGLAHFVWSSALTLPLYGALFGAEWGITHSAWNELLLVSDVRMVPVILAGAARFMGVLGPWIILTLPLMVVQYEWVPAVMSATGCGPIQACGLAVAAARKNFRACILYFILRALLQVAGTAVMSMCLTVSVLVSALLSLPVLLIGWGLTAALGGLSAPPGQFAAAVTGAVMLSILYCVLATILTPLSLTVHALAGHFLGALDPRLGPLRPKEDLQ
jgi:hypothetical protein